MKHAFTNRTLYGGGLLVAALGAVQVAHAGYATIQPPTAVQGGPGAYQIKKTADIAIQKAAASANAYMKGVGRIPGVSAPIPFMTRIAASAPVGAARFLFLNPGVALGAAAVSFLASEYMTYEDGSWFYSDPAANQPYPQSTGYTYRVQIKPDGYTVLSDSGVKYTELDACQAMVGKQYSSTFTINSFISIVQSTYNRQCKFRVSQTSNGAYPQDGHIVISQTSNPSCPSGWYVTPAGCVQSPPPSKIEQTIDDFVEKVAPSIAPEKIPDYVPDYVVPVEDPIISPDTTVDPDTATPKPYYIPVGDPQLIPGTDPAKYTQPMIRVQPSPTVADPWRVDLQPVNRVSEEPTPVTTPTQNPTAPSGSGSPPTAEANQDPDLCEKNPDILACSKPELDTPEQEIPKDSISISYESEDLGSGGSCIAPVNISYFGHSTQLMDTNMACGWISAYIRPVALLVAAFLSLGIVVGGLKTE